jgi:hypothetical protein
VKSFLKNRSIDRLFLFLSIKIAAIILPNSCHATNGKGLCTMNEATTIASLYLLVLLPMDRCENYARRSAILRGVDSFDSETGF